MKIRNWMLAAVGAAALAAAAGVSFANDNASDVATLATPERADTFRLIDDKGWAHDLRRLSDAKAIVVVTQVNGDAGSRQAAKTLAALKAQHPGVEFLMLNSSLTDDRASIVAEAKGQGFAVRVLDDDLQLAGEQLGATYAGEAYLLEAKTLKVLYHGPVDGSAAKKKAKGYLAEALADVGAGRAVAVSYAEGKGKAIDFPERARIAEHKSISYVKDVAPVLEAKCVTCHQTGGIGPFAMESYDVVRGFAPMIRESIRTDTMPPWHPDPIVGSFKHDQSLTPKEIKTLVHWVEAGAPRGEGADPLASVKHEAPVWPLGKPDLELDIPSYQVPAAGVVEYQYPFARNPLTEGRWVKAATLMPGNRQAVHHILAGYMAKDPPAGAASTALWEASYGEYAVGGESFRVPDDIGIYLPPGGAMGFQMHYTPYGKDASDTSKMGLYFYPVGVTPKQMMRHAVIADPYIELPPNEQSHEEIAYAKFPKDAVLYSVFLHTHYRGKAGRFEIVYPDGKRKTLVNLPRYDFNWQRTYDFKEPVNVPAGSKLVATYIYDNSKRNSANPDPNATVIWGDQSWEEMHYTSIYYRWNDETVAKQIPDEKARLREFSMMGILDTNLDEKVQKDELKGRMAKMIGPQFDKVDTDKDGSLNQTELLVMAKALPQFGRRVEAAVNQASTNE